MGILKSGKHKPPPPVVKKFNDWSMNDKVDIVNSIGGFYNRKHNKQNRPEYYFEMFTLANPLMCINVYRGVFFGVEIERLQIEAHIQGQSDKIIHIVK